MNATHHISDTATKPFKGEFPRACIRCGGTGMCGPTVVFQGRCFRCPDHPGTDPKPGKEWVFPASWTEEQIAEFLQKKEDAKCERAAKKAAARRSLMDEQCEQYPALATLRKWQDEAPTYDPDTDEMTDGDPHWFFVWHVAQDIVRQAFSYRLTEKQVALLERQVEQAQAKVAEKAQREADQAAAKAAALPVPTGRVTITGTVVSRKWYEGDFGSTCKLLILGADGWKVFVTEPSSLRTEVGDVVTMTCNVTAADDDPTFGKGKRPTKASVVTPVTEVAS